MKGEQKTRLLTMVGLGLGIGLGLSAGREWGESWWSRALISAGVGAAVILAWAGAVQLFARWRRW
jgi:hypothetical protein